MSTVESDTPKNSLTASVVSDSQILGGKPCSAGTRVRVQDIYRLFEREQVSIDEILEAYPHLTHAQVHVALAFAWENRDDILKLLSAEERFDRELESFGPSLTEKLRARQHAQNH